MRRRFLECAVGLVRSWTRAYTTGMGAEVRRRRCAEIESDIWESLHDTESGASGLHIVARFARGMPADVLWRLEHAMAGGQRMWRTLAFLCIAAATVMVMLWSFAPRSGLQSLPTLPASPTPNYIEKRRKPPPPPPGPGPTWEEFVAKVTGKPPKKPAAPPNTRR
jgi:hypothetical protein